MPDRVLWVSFPVESVLSTGRLFHDPLSVCHDGGLRTRQTETADSHGLITTPVIGLTLLQLPALLNFA